MPLYPSPAKRQFFQNLSSFWLPNTSPVYRPLLCAVSKRQAAIPNLCCLLISSSVCHHRKWLITVGTGYVVALKYPSPLSAVPHHHHGIANLNLKIWPCRKIYLFVGLWPFMCIISISIFRYCDVTLLTLVWCFTLQSQGRTRCRWQHSLRFSLTFFGLRVLLVLCTHVSDMIIPRFDSENPWESLSDRRSLVNSWAWTTILRREWCATRYFRIVLC